MGSGKEIVFLEVTWSAHMTFNKSSNRDEKDYFLKKPFNFFPKGVSLYEKRDLFLNH